MPTLTVMPDGVVVDLAEGETVLEGLYRHGYAFRVGCRRGGCAICKVDCRSGEFQYNHAVADTVITNAAFAQQNPQAVTAFMKASIQGWREAMNNPAAGLEAVMKIQPTLDRAHQTAMLPEAARLMKAGAAATQGLFVIDPVAIKKAHDFFVEQRVLQAPIDLAAAYRPELLQAIPLAIVPDPTTPTTPITNRIAETMSASEIIVAPASWPGGRLR